MLVAIIYFIMEKKYIMRCDAALRKITHTDVKKTISKIENINVTINDHHQLRWVSHLIKKFNKTIDAQKKYVVLYLIL